jgi:alpha-L-fucosidase
LKQYQVPEWYQDAKFGMWAHWGPQCEAEDGDWYARNMYEEGGRQYKDHLKAYGHPSVSGFKDEHADVVIQTLADVVSKNGVFLLNVPVRGDGTIVSVPPSAFLTERKRRTV